MPSKQPPAMTRHVGLRVDSDELAVLDGMAGAVGCSRAELLRAAVQLAAERDVGELREVVAGLPRVAERRERNQAMAEARAAGETWAQIAERFGVAPSSARWGALTHRAETADVLGDARRLRVVGGRCG